METKRVQLAPSEALTTIFKSPAFATLCAKAGIPVTRRQASKFHNGYGAAFNAKNK